MLATIKKVERVVDRYVDVLCIIAITQTLRGLLMIMVGASLRRLCGARRRGFEAMMELEVSSVVLFLVQRVKRVWQIIRIEFSRRKFPERNLNRSCHFGYYYYCCTLTHNPDLIYRWCAYASICSHFLTTS